jgi:hypothetical protein
VWNAFNAYVCKAALETLTMRHRTLAVAVLLTLPALAFAQQGGGRNVAGNELKKIGGSFASVKLPSPGDVDDMNIARMLIDKRGKLSLSDAAVVVLQSLQKKLHESIAPTLESYNAARAKYRELTGAPDAGVSADNADEIQKALQAAVRPLNAIREQRQADAAEALTIVPEAQRAAAAALIKDQDSEFAKMLPRGGGNRGRP